MYLPKGYCLQNGKYGLTEVIGQGGFGITYSGVWNTEVKGELGAVKTAVPVCIKEYFFKDYCYRDPATMQVRVHSETGRMLFDKFREKQIEEARILSEVHHPYIVNVLEVFEENNTAYIAMERIAGQSLKSILEGCGRLTEQRALKYIGQIGRALEFVHGKSILHLDIKPGNILIDAHDDARLIDFGVSKRYDIGDQATSTTTLTLSKGFASIEQYDSDGLAGFSPRPDIYSLGATLYNLLTGSVPPESILRVTKPLVKPSELNADITPKTEHAILKALQVDPADRYPSVRALLDDLDIPPYPEKEDHPIPTDEAPTPAPTAADDECTQLLTDDAEATILITPPSGEPPAKPVRKSRRRMLVPLLICASLLIGWAASYLIGGNRQPASIAAPVAEQAAPGEPGADRTAFAQPTDEAPTHPATEKEHKREAEEKHKAEKKAEEAKPDAPEKSPKSEEPADAANTRYTALIASGRAKMDRGAYAEAKADLMRAKEIKVTEEVIRLALACDDRMEEEGISARKALYEPGMPFGNYTIVRKKQNGRYGAIDARGIERIRCIYLSVGRSENGRAFEREDHLYDIYNTSGAMVARGLTTY
ncbi:protein kinase [Tannerella sp. oral taxon 808]|nr:protein kinase [Tannerella sp. oral taxon 808]